jgi:hypothetical protein
LVLAEHTIDKLDKDEARRDRWIIGALYLIAVLLLVLILTR